MKQMKKMKPRKFELGCGWSPLVLGAAIAAYQKAAGRDEGVQSRLGLHVMLAVADRCSFR